MVGQHFHRYGIVGHSRAVADVIRRIELVSATRSTVLITGETGTGKELVARAVHNRSAQRDMPFIKVNCAAIPETLLESELFGHVRGAFTDATRTKKGKFSLANRGSIFLDEIGTMSVGLQAKLLRVLQEREIEPLGAERTEHVDVRVIAATNRDLRQLVARVGSRTISSIACTWSRSSCPRFASARRIFRCWWSTSPTSMRHGWANRSMRWRTALSRCSRSITGRATCVSSRTRSSAPSC